VRVLDVVIILVVSVAEEIQEKLNMHRPATIRTPLPFSLTLLNWSETSRRISCWYPDITALPYDWLHRRLQHGLS
jgi:hypothetical protein